MGRRMPKRGRDLRRPKPTRTELDRILIVTEGSKTEPLYFRMLIKELDLTTAKVQIVGDGGSAPISVVNEAKRRLQSDRDFEQIYCVFDRDRHQSYNEALTAITVLADSREFKGKAVRAITSVPCFEFWYLLHVSNSRKPYEGAATGGSPADALLKDLRCAHPCFKDYGKAECASFFDEIAANRGNALTNAEAFLAQAREEGAKIFHENPSTRVHIVVRALMGIARN